MIHNNQPEWLTSVALTSGENRLIEQGAPGSAVALFESSPFHKLTWFINTELTATFTVEGALDEGFSAVNVLYTIGVLAATNCTPYNLAAPMNQLGYVVINSPFIRLRLQDTATANHAHTRFYAKAWE